MTKLPNATPPASGLAAADAKKLPATLFDTFWQYKQHTNRVASWLGNMAQSLGYSIRSPPPPPPPTAKPAKAGGRLKGNARKAAAAAEKQTATGPAAHAHGDVQECPNSPPPTPLTTSEFIDIAQYIANSATASVPYQIIKWASRAIASRRKCAQWYSIEAAGDQEGNSAHDHFIGILEQVVSILKPCVARGGGGRSSKGGVQVKESRFAALGKGESVVDDVDDNDDDDDDEADWDTLLAASLPKSTSKSTSTNKKGGKSKKAPAEPPLRRFIIVTEDRMDFLFALLALLGEYHEVRTFVKHTWAEYIAGDVSLEEATFLTTAALDKMYQVSAGRIREEFPGLMYYHHHTTSYIFNMMTDGGAKAPRGSGAAAAAGGSASGQSSASDSTGFGPRLMEKLQDVLGFEVPVIQFDLDCGSDDDDDDKIDSDVHCGLTTMEWAQYTMLAATEVLEMACEAARTGSAPRIDNKVRQRAEKHGLPERFLPELLEQANVLVELHASWQALVGEPCLDKVPHYLIGGLAKGDDKHPTYLSVLFLTQVHLDIHHIVTTSSLTNPTRVFDDYARSAFHHLSSIQYFADNIAPDTSTLHYPHAQEMVPGYMCKQTASWALFESSSDPVKRKHMHTVMAANPLLAGKLAIHTHYRAATLGVGLVEHYGIVLFAGFVYRAIQLLDEAGGNLPLAWPLMDDLLAEIGHESLFRGPVPTSMAEACSRIKFIMAKGVPNVNLFQRGWEWEMQKMATGNKNKVAKVKSPPMGAPTPAFAFGRPLMQRVLADLEIDRSSIVLDHGIAQHRAQLGDFASSAAAEAADLTAQLPCPFTSSNTIPDLEYLRKHLPSFMPVLGNNYLVLHSQAQQMLMHVVDRLAHALPIRMQTHHAGRKLGDVAAIQFWTWQLLLVLAMAEGGQVGKDSPSSVLSHKEVEEVKEVAVQVVLEAKAMVKEMISSGLGRWELESA